MFTKKYIYCIAQEAFERNWEYNGKWPEQFMTAEVLAICKTLNRNRLYCNNELAEDYIEAIKDDVTGKKRIYK